MRTKVEEVRQATRIHGGVLNMLAAAAGVRLSRLTLPRALRLRVYNTVYGKRYPALDEAELEKPLAEYPSLNALFTRGVPATLRPISQAPDTFVAPCDGRVQDVGRVDAGRILTVKGIDYTLASLLPGVDVRPFERGHFAIVFLSPRDCHRVFSPQDATLAEAAHVPGYRLLVHPPYQTKEFPVFTLNERVIFQLSTPPGACVLVMVAGWGVGNITLPFDPGFRPRGRSVVRRRYDRPLRRGEWLATFELGSTCILLMEPKPGMEALVVRDDAVRYGQPLFGPGRET